MNLVIKSKTAIQNSRLFPVQTLTLCLPIPRTWQLWVTVLHFRVDDLMQKVRSKSDTVEHLIENKRKTAVKCMSHGASKVFVLAIVRNKRIPK